MKYVVLKDSWPKMLLLIIPLNTSCSMHSFVLLFTRTMACCNFLIAIDRLRKVRYFVQDSQVYVLFLCHYTCPFFYSCSLYFSESVQLFMHAFNVMSLKFTLVHSFY